MPRREFFAVPRASDLKAIPAECLENLRRLGLVSRMTETVSECQFRGDSNLIREFSWGASSSTESGVSSYLGKRDVLVDATHVPHGRLQTRKLEQSMESQSRRMQLSKRRT